MRRWLSGRKRRPAKALVSQEARRFESFSSRQIMPNNPVRRQAPSRKRVVGFTTYGGRHVCSAPICATNSAGAEHGLEDRWYLKYGMGIDTSVARHSLALTQNEALLGGKPNLPWLSRFLARLAIEQYGVIGVTVAREFVTLEASVQL